MRKDRSPSQTLEIKNFGQTFDFDDFSVNVRCYAIAEGRRRFELWLTGGGRTGVVDVPEHEHGLMAERISHAVLHFADSIRLASKN
jgi:hypothetical protein